MEIYYYPSQEKFLVSQGETTLYVPFTDLEKAYLAAKETRELLERSQSLKKTGHLPGVPHSFTVVKLTHCTVELENESSYRSDVFLQGDGRLKCLNSHCTRSYTCEHVQFVKQHVTLPPEPPTILTQEEIEDILNY